MNSVLPSSKRWNVKSLKLSHLEDHHASLPLAPRVDLLKVVETSRSSCIWPNIIPVHFAQGNVRAQPCVLLDFLLDGSFPWEEVAARETRGILSNPALHTAVMLLFHAACLWDKGGCSRYWNSTRVLQRRVKTSLPTFWLCGLCTACFMWEWKERTGSSFLFCVHDELTFLPLQDNTLGRVLRAGSFLADFCYSENAGILIVQILAIT